MLALCGHGRMRRWLAGWLGDVWLQLAWGAPPAHAAGMHVHVALPPTAPTVPFENVPHFLSTCPFYQQFRDQLCVLFLYPCTSAREWQLQPALALCAAFFFFLFPSPPSFFCCNPAAPQPNATVSSILLAPVDVARTDDDCPHRVA